MEVAVKEMCCRFKLMPGLGSVKVMPALNKVPGYISGCGGDDHPFCLLCSCKNTFVFSICATQLTFQHHLSHLIFPPCVTLENTEQIEKKKNVL